MSSLSVILFIKERNSSLRGQRLGLAQLIRRHTTGRLEPTLEVCTRLDFQRVHFPRRRNGRMLVEVDLKGPESALQGRFVRER